MKTDRILQQALRLARDTYNRIRMAKAEPAKAPQGKPLPKVKHRREWTED